MIGGRWSLPFQQIEHKRWAVARQRAHLNEKQASHATYVYVRLRFVTAGRFTAAEPSVS